MNQTEAFLRVGGDTWYDLNVNDLGKEDPVSHLMGMIGYKPKSILELGCSNGWRLERMKKQYDCAVMGIDPSAKAVKSSNLEHGEEIRIGTADDLSAESNGRFDVIIYGHCFICIDPDLYFKVMAEGNRVLCDGGLVFLHERLSPFPLKRQYAVTNGGFELMFYTMNFPSLWLAHPFYKQVAELSNPDNYEAVVSMQKNIGAAFVQGSHQSNPKFTPSRH
jgi:SAM-dependent methyltransferase